jgi:hypothetical protein
MAIQNYCTTMGVKSNQIKWEKFWWNVNFCRMAHSTKQYEATLKTWKEKQTKLWKAHQIDTLLLADLIAGSELETHKNMRLLAREMAIRIQKQ